MKALICLPILLFFGACASVLVQHEFAPSAPPDKVQYELYGAEKGIVLIGVNWDRSWNCGGYENAELRSVGFDLLPVHVNDNGPPPDIVLNGSHDGRGYINFVFLVKPGQYGISYVRIKVAGSMSDVGYFTAYRSSLIKDGNPVGGTFNVAAGEAVYIGHFGLDCAQEPMLWRYYLEDRRSFDDYLTDYRENYPYLKFDDVQYRLFSTREFGYEFSLQ